MSDAPVARRADKLLRHPPAAQAGKLVDGARAYPPYDHLDTDYLS
jgi:hypothetical protein